MVISAYILNIIQSVIILDFFLGKYWRANGKCRTTTEFPRNNLRIKKKTLCFWIAYNIRKKLNNL